MVNKKFICAKCGEADPANFYSNSRVKCKNCQKEESRQKYSSTQTCLSCGTTDKTLFENYLKKRCIHCDPTHKQIMQKKKQERKAYLYHNDPEYRKRKIDQIRENQKNKIYHYRHMAAKHRALRKKMEFNITPEYLETLHELQNYKCRYSKLDITNQFAIDRIDSSKGYIVGNIALTANAVNNIKSNMTLDQFIYVTKKLYENLVQHIPQEKLDKLEIKFNNEIIWATV